MDIGLLRVISKRFNIYLYTQLLHKITDLRYLIFFKEIIFSKPLGTFHRNSFYEYSFIEHKHTSEHFFSYRESLYLEIVDNIR